MSCNCSGGTVATEIPYRKSCSWGKLVFSIRQKGVPPLLLPASVLQLPRCLTRTYNLDSHDSIFLNGTVSKNAIAAGKIDCKNNLLRKCGLLAHTLAAFLKNCCTEKLLVCLRLVLCNTPLQTKKHRRSDAFSRFTL